MSCTCTASNSKSDLCSSDLCCIESTSSTVSLIYVVLICVALSPLVLQ